MILFTSFEKNFRGGEKQTLYLINSLKYKGIQSSLLCLPETPFYHKAKENNIHIIPYTSFINIMDILKKYNEFDIIHTLNSKSNELFVYAKPIIRKPIIHTRRVAFPLNNLLSIAKYKANDRIIVLTNYYKNYLRRLGIKKVSVIPDMVVPKKLNKARASELLSKLNIKNNFIIGVISALDESKDPFTLLSAFMKISRKYPDTVVLHFGDGSLKNRITRFISENNLVNKYFLMGHIDEVEDFYTIFNLFISSAKIEGMGSSILEAFLYRVPVIAPNLPTITEYAQNRAILFEKGNSDSLYLNVKNLLDNKCDLTELTSKAYNYVITNHSEEKITEMYINEYNRLAK